MNFRPHFYNLPTLSTLTTKTFLHMLVENVPTPPPLPPQIKASTPLAARKGAKNIIIIVSLGKN